jgi:hypothetical protein
MLLAINQTLPLKILQRQPIIPACMVLSPILVPFNFRVVRLEFFQETDRPQSDSTQQAKERCPELPQLDNNPAARCEKPYKLIDLI